MRRTNSLFIKGWMTRQMSLFDILARHHGETVGRIQAVTDLGQLTDAVLDGLVKDAVVEPLHLAFDRTTCTTRTEEFDGTQFPHQFSFNVRRGRTYPKLVCRVSVPFTGDAALLEHPPNTGSTVFPHGDVHGQTIQFDVTYWGYADDNERVRHQIDDNRRLLKLYSGSVNTQVAEFNAGLANSLRPVFEAKLDQLTRQLSVFDSLGIELDRPDTPAHPTPPPRERKSPGRHPTRIIQYVQAQFVERLTQINHNAGDVNNAIQSS